MTPYSRFRLVSNLLAATLVTGAVCAVWAVASGMVATATGGLTPAYWASVGGTVAAVVAGWVLLTELVLPLVFHFGPLRRMILGRDFAEGTWLQAERGMDGDDRITVLHIRPAGFGFRLSGHTFGPDFQVDSNRMVEFSAFDGPMMRYVYRSLMPDGSGHQPHALSELAFDRIRSAPKSYLGFVQATGSSRKVRVEGVKLTKWADRRRLRKADQRAAVLEKYWDVFFASAPAVPARMDEEAPPPKVRRPVIVTAATTAAAEPAFTERRKGDAAPDETTVVVPRRRASDWRSEDTTPTADRIRARMMESEPEIEEEETFEDEVLDEIDEAAEEDELILEDLYEDAGDEEEDYADEVEEDEDAYTDEADEYEDDADGDGDDEDEEAYADSEDECEADAEDADTYDDEEEYEEDVEEESDAEADHHDEDEDTVEEEDDDTPVLRRNRFAGR